MSDVDELLARVENLKTVAKEHQAKQERARVLEEQARQELDVLTEKLAQFFATTSWSDAEKMLPELRADAEKYLAEVEDKLDEAGLL